MRKLIMVLRVSIQSVIAHKMRSFLTMLGVVIGVAAVIALVAVGAGAQAQVVSQFTSLGSNLLVVSPASSFSFRPPEAGGFQQTTRELNTQDVSAITRLMPGSVKGLVEVVATVFVMYTGSDRRQVCPASPHSASVPPSTYFHSSDML